LITLIFISLRSTQNSLFKIGVAVLLQLTGEEDTPIGAMPGCYRLGWQHGLIEEVLYYYILRMSIADGYFLLNGHAFTFMHD
jgi:hypothetical protein